MALSLIVFTVLLSQGNAAKAQTIRYVKKGATGNNDGTSWENAYTELANVLKWAADNKGNWETAPLKIYVAKGTYKPLYKMAEANIDGVPGTTRDNAFVLVKNVQLYGGFDPDNGISSLDNTRIFGNNGTILSGDLDGNDASDIPVSNLLSHETRANNAYRVVLSAGDVGSACLDGFTVSGGNGNKDGNYLPVNGQNVYPAMGGGIANVASSPKLTNLIVRDNAGRQSGGGIYNWGSYPQISNSTITRNWTNQFGGGISENYSQSTISNVVISYNSASSSGGGLHTGAWASVISNVAIHHNYAATRGGGIYNEGSSEFKNVSVTDNTMGSTGVGGGLHSVGGEPRFMNTTMSRNSATYYTAGIYVAAGKTRFFNSIIWGNTMVNGTVNNIYKISGAAEFQYNFIQGSTSWKANWGTDLGNNIDADPLFTNAAGGDYTLSENSPAKNAGSNTQYQNAGGNLATDKDLAGKSRLRGSTIDMGAYEAYVFRDVPVRYVRQGGTGDGYSWDDASGDLQAMINESSSGNQIWVGSGTYVPNRKMTDPGTITQNNAENTFLLKEGVAVYGGFRGNETQLDQRNWNTQEAILSGRFEGGNAYHVVLAAGNQEQSFSPNTKMDGFTITGGNAVGAANSIVNGQTIINVNGGGIYNLLSSVTFSNLKVKTNNAQNLGGGILNWSGNSIFTNVTATGNTAQSGGAVAGYNGNPIFFNTKVSGNAATYGGGFYILNSTLSVTGGLFSGNTASFGGGFYNGGATVVLTNATMGSNTGYGIYNLNGVSLKIQNSILFGNDNGVFGGTVSYSNSLAQGISGRHNGTLDGDIDPMFTNLPVPGLTTDGDFNLQGCSWAINAGQNSFATGIDKDLSGNNRIFGNAADLGAYEYQSAIQTSADRLATNADNVTIQTENGKTYRVTSQNESCRSLATIRSTGLYPVTGNVTLTTWIDGSVKSFNGSPYVQRHYDITPALNTSTATAKVTLYFTQAEFNAFNTANQNGKLPANADDNSGKTNLRVFQYHGAASGENGPGALSGPVITIDPDENNIVWDNAPERWEITFDVTGFSSFFIGSNATPLPVKLVSFEGKLEDDQAVSLKWVVTEQENILEYVVEYSANGRDFKEVGRVPATSHRDNIYNYKPVHAFNGNKAYYRLHILEADADSFSRIISVNVPEQSKTIVYPMPARDIVWLKGAQLMGSEITLLDVQGRIVKTIKMQSDEQQIDISNLSSGIYLLQMPFGGIQKIVKQ